VIIVMQFPEFDDIYCRYSYVYGHDWDISSVSLAFLTHILLTFTEVFINSKVKECKVNVEL